LKWSIFWGSFKLWNKHSQHNFGTFKPLFSYYGESNNLKGAVFVAVERHIYPGNNTTEGFYSYYNYILGQREANRIICIKGGPGVGKSTFMKKIGETYLEKGEDVDFMHCSSDNNSLDGVVLKNRRIALIDATSPHVVVS